MEYSSPKSDTHYIFDNIDYKILDILNKNARKPFSEIANLLKVSPGTIHFRMRRLEDLGVVKGSKLVIDYQKLGYDLTAFIGIYMEKSALLKNVKAALLLIDEITNIHYTTGVYGLFISMKCKNTAHLREVVQNQIQMIDGIQRTETIISLEESITKDIKLYIST